jgi:regulator of sirC expression with transglutaminase-like and TPR domain
VIPQQPECALLKTKHTPERSHRQGRLRFLTPTPGAATPTSPSAITTGAISDFDQAIRLSPKDADAYTNRGAAHIATGDYNRAISDLDQAIRLDPKYAVAYATRGEAYEAKNDPDQAIADFNQALKLEPSLADARQGRERMRLVARRAQLAACQSPLRRAMAPRASTAHSPRRGSPIWRGPAST